MEIFSSRKTYPCWIVQDFDICFQSTAVQISTLSLRRKDVLDTLCVTLCYRLTYCNDNTQKGKSLWIHISLYTVHITHFAYLWLHETHCSQNMDPSATQWLAETCQWETIKQRRLLQKEFSQEVWWAVHQHFVQYFHISFFDITETTSPTNMQLESVRRREPSANALYGPEGDENMTLRMGSQGNQDQKRTSEELTRSKPEVMERHARYALFHQNHQFQFTVRQH